MELLDRSTSLRQSKRPDKGNASAVANAASCSLNVRFFIATKKTSRIARFMGVFGRQVAGFILLMQQIPRLMAVVFLLIW